MTKYNDHFIALLVDGNTLYTSWKVDTPKWKDRIEKAEKNTKRGSCIFIEINSIKDDRLTLLDSIPVHGTENKWHLFIKKHYCGKRIVVTLSYHDRTGKSKDILWSSEIDIPARDSIPDEQKALYEMSGINLNGPAGFENTSR